MNNTELELAVTDLIREAEQLVWTAWSGSEMEPPPACDGCGSVGTYCDADCPAYAEDDEN